MDSIKKDILEKEVQKGKLYGYVQNDVKFKDNVVLLKDINYSVLGCDDIVIAYAEDGSFVSVYQGVFTANKIIGVREVKLYGSGVQSLLKEMDVDYLSLDSALKIDRARKYMCSSRVKDLEIVFFGDVVCNN